MASGLTLGIARAVLPSMCFDPGAASTAAGAAAPINVVTAWLLSHGKFKGTVQKTAFAVYDNQVTLPRNLLTVLSGVVRGTGDRSTVACRYALRNEWYEFLPGGPGLSVNPPCSTDGFTAQGDGFVTFRDLPAAGKIKIYAETTESAGSSHVRGITGGLKLFTGSGGSRIEGENIAMPTTGGASTLSATTFDAGTSLYHIVKPATNGLVTLFHVDPTSAVETLLGRYEPGERTPIYRRYLVPSRTDDSDQVVALCKLRHVNVVVDNDEIIPGNLNALELGLQALNYRRKDDLARANTYIAMAVEELNSELGEYNAEGSYGRVQTERIGSMAEVCNLV